VGRHWRESKSNLPDQTALVDYIPLIRKIVSVARGEARRPRDIYSRFKGSFSIKYFGPNSNSRVNPFEIIREYRDSIQSLSREDLEQECFYFLLELYDFYKLRWKTTNNRAFYDYARIYLTQWLAKYIALEIKKYLAEEQETQYISEESYSAEETEILKLDINWVFLKLKDGIFSRLSVKQKYMLYLRYTKELQNEDISKLMSWNKAKLEQEFANIKHILRGSYDCT
jgi:hypothetical protein